MKVNILILLSVGLALFGFLDQGLGLILDKAQWDWSQVAHHETLILMSLAVTIGLAVGKYWR